MAKTKKKNGIPDSCPKCKFEGLETDQEKTHWLLSTGSCSKCGFSIWKYQRDQAKAKVEFLDTKIFQTLEERNKYEGMYESQKYENAVLEMELDEIKGRNTQLEDLILQARSFAQAGGEWQAWNDLVDETLGITSVQTDDIEESPKPKEPEPKPKTDTAIDYKYLVEKAVEIERKRIYPLIEAARKCSKLPCPYCKQTNSHGKDCELLELVILSESF